jgi:hypothetical protein
MRNQFFIERYARDKHEAYLRQADHDRRTHTRLSGERHPQHRVVQVPIAAALPAMAIVVVALAAGTRIIAQF